LLYRSTSFAEISLIEYARHLAPQVVNFFQLGDRVRVDIQGDGATLEIQRAVPYGVLLNELVSNACKHAFPPERRGALAICIRRDDAAIVLTVSDDGVGMPDGFNYQETTSLGLKLIHMLSGQLGGEVMVSGGSGTRVEVRFPATLPTDGDE